MVYSLDGQLNEPVPLTDHYVSWVSGHHNESYVDGSAPLPVLSEGSHAITVYLECVHEIGYHDHIETFHYFDNETVYFIVGNTAQPTPTDNYTSPMESETSMPEPESYPTLLITEVAFSVAIACCFCSTYCGLLQETQRGKINKD